MRPIQVGVFLLSVGVISACAGQSPGADTPALPTAAPRTDQAPATAAPSTPVAQAVASMQFPTATLLPAEPPPAGATAEFTTDFTKHSVPYADILTGGPPKDGIPAIDAPTLLTASR